MRSLRPRRRMQYRSGSHLARTDREGSVQLNKLNPAIAASLERYTSGDSGYLSGSCSRFDDAGMLEVKDSLGQVSVVVICLPGTLVVSSRPPSGCVLPSRLRALERSGYEAVAGTWTMPLTGRVPGCVLLSPRAQGFVVAVSGTGP